MEKDFQVNPQSRTLKWTDSHDKLQWSIQLKKTCSLILQGRRQRKWDVLCIVVDVSTGLCQGHEVATQKVYWGEKKTSLT